MGALDSLKDWYFKMEERYYHLLDKIDTKIPIYKVVDPIDKVIPSFALCLILIVVVAGLLAYFLIGGEWIWPGGGATFTLTVLDDDDPASTIPNLDVLVTYKEATTTYTTDDLGRIFLIGLETGETILIEIDDEEFQYFEGEYEIEDQDNADSINLTKVVAGRTYTVYFVDELGVPIIDDTLDVTFTCSDFYSHPDPENPQVSSGSVTVTVPNTCGTLRVSVESSKYGNLSSTEVTADGQNIMLEAIDVLNGTISVTATKQNGDAISGLRINIYRYSELLDNPLIGPFDYEITNSAGYAEFSVAAGTYVLRTQDDLLRYAMAESDPIAVQVQGTASWPFILTQEPIGTIKIQVVDKLTKEEIEGASVKLMRAANNDVIAGPTKTDANGMVTFSVAEDIDYRVTAQSEGYQLGRLSNVRISTSVQKLEMSKCTPATCGHLVVQVADQDGDFVENATVALYSVVGNEEYVAGYDYKVSDINGLAKFSGVSSGTYFAFAFKGANSGKSASKYFTATTGNESEPYEVIMEIPEGVVEVQVVDQENKPIPFPTITFYDALDDTPIGTGTGTQLGDDNGYIALSTKADKKVYVVVSQPGYTQYVSHVVEVLPATVQTLKARLLPEIIGKELEVEFMGMYKDGKLVNNQKLAAGEEYVARFRMLMPTEVDYDAIGLHMRVGKQVIMEQDLLFIKEINAPLASVVKVASYDEQQGLPEENYPVTNSYAKWTNMRWSDPAAGIYEAEAVIQVKGHASIGQQLMVYYRGWAEKENNVVVRYPEDDTVSGPELYSNTKQEMYEVGISTFCDEKFCFSANIVDLEAELSEQVTDSYQAKILNGYELFFSFINNSPEGTNIYNDAELRIKNPDESLLFEEYSIVDAETKTTQGTLNGYEFPWFSVGDLSPNKSIKGQMKFTTQKAMAAVINMQVVSQQRIVYEKNLTISVAAARELEVSLSSAKFASGIENDLDVLVKDKGTGLELSDVLVKVKDKFGNIVASDETPVTGKVKFTLPAQKPGAKLRVVSEKPDYQTNEQLISIKSDVIEISPENLGLSLDTKNKTDATREFTIKNVTGFPLKIIDMQLHGDFKEYLDLQESKDWLIQQYIDRTIGTDKTLDASLRVVLSEAGKAVTENQSLQGKLTLIVGNFGEQWLFSVPVAVSIGLGGNVDNPACLTISKNEWTSMSQGNPLTMQFTIKNNCTVDGEPIGLKFLEAKVEYGEGSNEIGEYKVSLEQGSVNLGSGYFRTLQVNVHKEHTYNALLTFTPYGGMTGVSAGTLFFRARNPAAGGDEVMEVQMQTTLTIVKLADCIGFDRHIIPMMEDEESAAFTVTTTGCGAPIDLAFESEIDLSSKEITVPDNSSQTIEISPRGFYPGQYSIFVYSKSETEKIPFLLTTLKARVYPTEDKAFMLSKFEYDVYYDPNSDPNFTGFDISIIENTQYEERVKVDLKIKNKWGCPKILWDSLIMGLLYGTGAFLINQLAASAKEAEGDTTGLSTSEKKDFCKDYGKEKGYGVYCPAEKEGSTCDGWKNSKSITTTRDGKTIKVTCCNSIDNCKKGKDEKDGEPPTPPKEMSETEAKTDCNNKDGVFAAGESCENIENADNEILQEYEIGENKAVCCKKKADDAKESALNAFKEDCETDFDGTFIPGKSTCEEGELKMLYEFIDKSSAGVCCKKNGAEPEEETPKINQQDLEKGQCITLDDPDNVLYSKAFYITDTLDGTGHIPYVASVYACMKGKGCTEDGYDCKTDYDKKSGCITAPQYFGAFTGGETELKDGDRRCATKHATGASYKGVFLECDAGGRTMLAFCKYDCVNGECKSAPTEQAPSNSQPATGFAALMGAVNERNEGYVAAMTGYDIVSPFGTTQGGTPGIVSFFGQTLNGITGGLLGGKWYWAAGAGFLTGFLTEFMKAPDSGSWQAIKKDVRLKMATAQEFDAAGPAGTKVHVKFKGIAEDALRLLQPGKKPEGWEKELHYYPTGTETREVNEDNLDIVANDWLDVYIADESESFVKNAKDPGLKNRILELVFTNNDVDGDGVYETTTKEIPWARLLEINGNDYEYKDSLKVRCIDEGGTRRFEMWPWGTATNVESSIEDKSRTRAYKQRYHLEFFAIPPDENMVPPAALMNCQAGTKSGVTGEDAFDEPESGMPRIELHWQWSAIDKDSCDEKQWKDGEENPDYFHCDATQFSIEVLKKLDFLTGELKDNVTSGNWKCPPALGGINYTENVIDEYDVGLSKMSIIKINPTDVNVIVEIENNDNPMPATVMFTEYKVENLDTGDVFECSDVNTIEVISKGKVGCEFEDLANGSYNASVKIDVTFPDECDMCYDSARSNSIAWSFTIGDLGIEQCEPFTTERLEEFLIASGVDEAETAKIMRTVHFKAYLIKDRFTKDFQEDFDHYAMTEAFFETGSEYSDNQTKYNDHALREYFANYDLFKFAPGSGEPQPEGHALSGPGLYDVFIDIEFDNGNWELFDADGTPTAEVRVRLTRLATPEPNSPFYYMPFDGLIGVSSGRVGYGVNYEGDKITINDDLEAPVTTTEISGSTPVSKGLLDVRYHRDFETMNNTDRGTIFKVEDLGSKYKMTYAPSYASPIILTIFNENDTEQAGAFYTVGIGTAAQPSGASMGRWYGLGYNCKAFDGRNMVEAYDYTADQRAIENQCIVIPSDRAPTTYGFEFCDMTDAGKMFLRSIFYTPQGMESFIAPTLANQKMILSSHYSEVEYGGTFDEESMEQAFPPARKLFLKGLGYQDIENVQTIFDLVRDEYVCVSTSGAGKVEFWWNPAKAFELAATEGSMFKGAMEDAELQCIPS